jgi:superfamily I DNA/RNA helicase
MMTLHASKGLEYPSVYILGVEEEILPHRSSIEADTVEEERRLAYVGITRAKRNLTMTFAAKRKQYGFPMPSTDWGGRNEVGGSSHNDAAILTPEEVLAVVESVLGGKGDGN